MQMASWPSRLHGFSRTAALVAALCLLAVCSGEDFSLEWSPHGVRDYNTSNPLVVELGDRILFHCPPKGNFNYSNLWIQNHEEQFKQCDCLAVPGEACDYMVAKNGQCIPNALDVLTLTIKRYDADLGSVFNFSPGRRYYLASYAPERTLPGAYSEASSGGQCLDGLKMVIEIAEIPTEPTTAESFQNATETIEDPSTEEVTVYTATSTASASGWGSGSAGMTEELTNATDKTVLEIVILQSQQIRDWHIAVIAVLGAVVLGLALAAALGAISFMLYRRRGEMVVNPELSVKEECKEKDVLTAADKSSYPVEVFKDPIDCNMILVQKFVSDNVKLQVSVLHATQVFCHDKHFPKGLLLRLFSYLYDMDVIEEESFFKWKEDVSEEFPGKGQALFQVNHWLVLLAESDEDGSSDEEN